MIPHLAEELWSLLGHDEMLCLQPWPEVNQDYLQETHMTLPIQVNGKTRAQISVPKDCSRDDIQQQAMTEVSKYIADKSLKKFIYVPGRIVNIVVG